MATPSDQKPNFWTFSLEANRRITMGRCSVSIKRDPERQLSIEGAYPGLSVGELRRLGWRRKSKGNYVLDKACAQTTDGLVQTVHGEALRLGPTVVLITWTAGQC
jgi:hypothetical protein